MATMIIIPTSRPMVLKSMARRASASWSKPGGLPTATTTLGAHHGQDRAVRFLGQDEDEDSDEDRQRYEHLCGHRLPLALAPAPLPPSTAASGDRVLDFDPMTVLAASAFVWARDENADD